MRIQPVRRTTPFPEHLTTEQQWRCERCNKLLGLIRAGRLHIRFARGNEYLVALPATCVCRGCQTLAEAPVR